VMNIVYTLMEWDGGDDYYRRGVVWEEMVKEVQKRGFGGGGRNSGGQEDGDGIDECVIRYCLDRCRIDDDTGIGVVKGKVKGKMEGCVRLDVDKIALYVAQFLFHSQLPDPWDKPTFISKWNRLMPGVGDEYEPKVELLRGVALVQSSSSPSSTSSPATAAAAALSASSSSVVLKYFPRDALPLDATQRIAALFKERARWRLKDLEPYLEALVESRVGVGVGVGIGGSTSTMMGILLKYACVVHGEKEEEDDSGENIWYIAKR